MFEVVRVQHRAGRRDEGRRARQDGGLAGGLKADKDEWGRSGRRARATVAISRPLLPPSFTGNLLTPPSLLAARHPLPAPAPPPHTHTSTHLQRVPGQCPRRPPRHHRLPHAAVGRLHVLLGVQVLKDGGHQVLRGRGNRGGEEGGGGGRTGVGAEQVHVQVREKGPSTSIARAKWY